MAAAVPLFMAALGSCLHANGSFITREGRKRDGREGAKEEEGRPGGRGEEGEGGGAGGGLACAKNVALIVASSAAPLWIWEV
jgi:hypothetical protein